MREERLEIAGVPARLYEPAGASGVLMLGHGGTSGKDAPRFVELARAYATMTGLAVVCIDAVDHGERRPLDVAPGLPARWHSSRAPQMVADWKAVTSALSSIGPPVAYVGFSMGAMFGLCVAAAMPDLRAAVFVVGAVPEGWVDDPPLRALLFNAAARLETQHVLMINKTDDELFTVAAAHELFDAITSPHRELAFWPGPHDDWPPDAIRRSADFVRERCA